MPNRSACRVYLVDDHEIIRETLIDYFRYVKDIELCGSASTAKEALQALPDVRCDIALIDVSMPEVNGVELVRRMHTAQLDIPCLMLSGYAEQMYIRSAKEAGARGYVLKGDLDALATAIRQVAQGGTYFDGVLQNDS
jgi:DNA-binding NarL/FixJ family response regulator